MPKHISPSQTSFSQDKDTANSLNPKFDDSIFETEITSVTILNHVKELTGKKVTSEKVPYNPFPINVFPTTVQEIIVGTNESLNFPIDFIGASLLYAASVAIGNTHRAEIMKGYYQNAVLYLAIVGRAGTNKSHPLSFALKPIEKRDDLQFQKYLSQKLEYDTIVSLSKKEREQQGYSDPVKPIWEQHLVTDFTPEALAEVHKFNKRGLGVYSDELASWFKNFNRYSKGSEEQFWLTVWSGKPIRINRKSSDPTYIPLPFISVAGTIQPGVLNELAKDRTENGFLDRLLFVIPNNLKKEYWSETELNTGIVENWETIITRILDISIIQDDSRNPQPETLQFSERAKQRLFEWQKEITDLSNKANNEAISGIYAKIEMYAARLALILEIMSYACGESDKQSISLESVKGAIELVSYFKNSAIKVQSIVSNANPLDKLPSDRQALYNSLPNYFTTNEGLEVAKDKGVAERTFKYFINNRDLFNNLKRGEYEKLF